MNAFTSRPRRQRLSGSPEPNQNENVNFHTQLHAISELNDDKVWPQNSTIYIKVSYYRFAAFALNAFDR